MASRPARHLLTPKRRERGEVSSYLETNKCRRELLDLPIPVSLPSIEALLMQRTFEIEDHSCTEAVEARQKVLGDRTVIKEAWTPDDQSCNERSIAAPFGKDHVQKLRSNAAQKDRSFEISAPACCCKLRKSIGAHGNTFHTFRQHPMRLIRRARTTYTVHVLDRSILGLSLKPYGHVVDLALCECLFHFHLPIRTMGRLVDHSL